MQVSQLMLKKLKEAISDGMVVYLSPLPNSEKNRKEQFPEFKNTSADVETDDRVIENSVVRPLGRVLPKISALAERFEFICPIHFWQSGRVVIPLISDGWQNGYSDPATDRSRFESLVNAIQIASQQLTQNAMGQTNFDYLGRDDKLNTEVVADEPAIGVVSAAVVTNFSLSISENEVLTLPERQHLAVARNRIKGKQRNIKGIVSAINESNQAIVIDWKYFVFGVRTEDYMIGQEVSLEVEFRDEVQRIECVNLVPQIPLA